MPSVRAEARPVLVAAASRRFGSTEEARTCVTFAANAGRKSSLVDLESYTGVLKSIWSNRFKSANLIIWNLSGAAWFAALAGRLFGFHVIHLAHEPGGLLSKLKKGDPVIYCFLASALEIWMRLLANVTGTPSLSNSKLMGIPYLPLLYNRVNHSWTGSANTIPIGICLGREDPRRSYSQLKELEANSSQFVSIDWFPGKNSDRSESAKLAKLTKASCVVNVYTGYYNQSGVTGDALRAGVPIIVSDLDPLANEIERERCGVVMNSKLVTAVLIQEAIIHCHLHRDLMSVSAYRVYESNFGERAFQLNWLPVLQ